MSTDALVFDETERGPDDDLRLQFEATARLDDEGKALVKALLEAVLLRQEARRQLASTGSPAQPPESSRMKAGGM